MKKLLICCVFSAACLFSWSKNFANEALFNAVDKLVLLKNKDFLESFEAFKYVLFKNLEDLKAQDSEGNTLLLKAIKSGNTFVIGFLLEMKFNPKEYVNIKNNKRERPLEVALSFYLNFYQEHLSNPKDKYVDIQTCVWREVIKDLLNCGADWSLSNRFLTPMHFVVKNNLIEILNLFYSVDSRDKEKIAEKFSNIEVNSIEPLPLSNCDTKLYHLIQPYLFKLTKN